MSQEQTRDYYEDLQVSSSAEPETIHRVYRLLAQQYHPDNGDTGNEGRFRVIAEAYHVLSDPDRRAQYDVVYHHQRQDRWRVVSAGADADNEGDGLVIVTYLPGDDSCPVPAPPAEVIVEAPRFTG